MKDSVTTIFRNKIFPNGTRCEKIKSVKQKLITFKISFSYHGYYKPLA